MKYIIYKATCLKTNKSYIGYTNNLERRKRLHKFKSKTGTSKFYQEIRSYGFNTFVWEILYESNCKETCFEQEHYFITKHNTIEEGLNTVKGSWRQKDPFANMDHELKCRLNNGRINKTFDELYGERALEIRENLRKAQHKYYAANPGIKNGLKNSNADHNIYTFSHRDGRIYTGKRQDFYNKHNLSISDRANISTLLKGRKGHCKGWTIV